MKYRPIKEECQKHTHFDTKTIVPRRLKNSNHIGEEPVMQWDGGLGTYPLSKNYQKS